VLLASAHPQIIFEHQKEVIEGGIASSRREDKCVRSNPRDENATDSWKKSWKDRRALLGQMARNFIGLPLARAGALPLLSQAVAHPSGQAPHTRLRLLPSLLLSLLRTTNS